MPRESAACLLPLHASKRLSLTVVRCRVEVGNFALDDPCVTPASRHSQSIKHAHIVLVGAIATSDRGTVYFAILNHGVPVPEARHRQDRFVRALLAQLRSIPWKYQPEARPAVALAEVASAP